MKPARRRQLVDHARSTWKVSIRRACSVLVTEPSTYHYKSRRTGQATLCHRMKEIAATRVRYGYRRIHVLLRREGWPVNAKRVYRLYRDMSLPLRNKSPKRLSKPNFGRIVSRRPDPMRSGRWTSCTISWRPGGSCECSPSSTPSPVSHRPPRCGSTFAAPTLLRCLTSRPPGRLPEGDPG